MTESLTPTCGLSITPVTPQPGPRPGRGGKNAAAALIALDDPASTSAVAASRGLFRAAGQLMVVRDGIIVNEGHLGRYAGPACLADGGRAFSCGGHIQ